MSKREFSDTVKLEALKENLERGDGEIRCEICGKKLVSVSECHFDHIVSYAKGGSSTRANCQILCVPCNLQKNDKELKDFVLEEKARRFLAGGPADGTARDPVGEESALIPRKMPKELFDRLIGDFIRIKGDIHKVDFSRAYNHLPSIHYVRRYYGDLGKLKTAFGLENSWPDWNRDSIKQALVHYVLENAEIYQKDMTKANGLPSVPCVLHHYPEYRSFSDIKRGLCNLPVSDRWTRENAIMAGKEYVDAHGKIAQKDLKAANHLPTGKVVIRLFGSLANYQNAVGSEVSQRNHYISKQEIDGAVDAYFGNRERKIESQKKFFTTFRYSPSTIYNRYGTFTKFCKEQGIQVMRYRKAKYTKREVDDAISNWVRAGNKMPPWKELVRLGLPSQSVILKFYEDWKEPFYLYEKIFEEVNRG